jgi:glucose/mannose transport system substrate-binding protein
MTKQVTHFRKLTLTLALALVLSLFMAACGDTPTNTSAPAAITTPAAGLVTTAAALPTSAAGAAKQKLEIFSWWTNGGEADGLNAMYDIFKKQNPTTEIVNATVSGGAGSNAKTVLVTRMQGGQPPDSFQVHAGQELFGTWVVANKMEPITALFKEQGWDKAMPKFLIDQITYKGEIYSVPVNIHRSNMLWYNKKVFEANGLTPPKTMDDFFKVAEALKAKGITPLAVGGKDKFEVPHLFESVLLATFGTEEYAKLFADGKLWTDPRMNTAIQTLEKMLSYSNNDRSALGWSDAAQRVLDGSAAMTIMGDWAEGYFLSKKAKPNVEFGWAAAPGNDGVFMWLSDSFGLPKGAKNRDASIAWLKVAGSKEGQDAFNTKKGSIPARTDADKSLYDEYLKWSIEQFGSVKLAPSVVHGAAANEAFMTAYGNALNVYSADKDAKTLANSLKDAANELKQ